MSDAPGVTGLLVAWSDGDQAAQELVIAAVYGELKQLARSYLRRERGNQSVSATTLVHDAYLKLVDQRRVRWQSRSHFFGIAAQAMRRLLVDRARAAKRGGRGVRIEPDESDASYLPPDVDVLALDEALSRLEALEPRWCRLVELRFFAGLTVGETASVLDVSPATVKRDWSLARAWLYRELQRSAPVTRGWTAAIKILRVDLARDRSCRERFEREARAISRAHASRRAIATFGALGGSARLVKRSATCYDPSAPRARPNADRTSHHHIAPDSGRCRMLRQSRPFG
jgi:RNA polymerase sigma-70 factor, ECF subfamily